LSESKEFAMRLTALLLLLSTAAAQAHEGHGLSGGHWHATDSILWIALAVGLGLWWSRK
jgi:hypothetical protein